ncbi:Uu.00g087220.m01.CDS01 [Anthostomella pinea]|uniref:Uu.00g087220.m01.CDS01 n=1 Tax=Anthostomella pinea TaxID=933095 RepID=A0AAI8VM83_9PEZI|nr:Uu.00g087220.m01.CDS01 [Anthostomella pinea]
MRPHKPLDSPDAKEAQWEAARGAALGAVKWGAASAVLGGVGYAFSPLYRGLTIQFKVYLQMSGMILGSMIEADYRMRQYEQHVRMQRRIARDRAVWDNYEKEFMEEDRPPPRPAYLQDPKK